MNRVLKLILISLLVGSIADAQQDTVYRIVVLSSGSTASDPTHPLIVGLLDGMREAGYVEGKNLRLSIPQNGSIDELRAIMERYKQEHVDVFITIGVTESAIAKEVFANTPIIFMPAVDPQRAGLVKSLAHPGTNLTGLAYDQGVEMQGKQLEIFKSIAPTLQELLVLYDANLRSPLHAKSLHLLNNVALHFGLRLIENPVKSYSEAEAAVSALTGRQGNGIFIICSNFFTRDRATPTIAIDKKLPLHGCPTQVLKYGGLVSYSPHLYYIGHRAAWYVNRILKGAQPQDLPVETPRKFELIINLKTAAVIGLTIPPEVLQRADKVIR